MVVSLHTRSRSGPVVRPGRVRDRAWRLWFWAALGFALLPLALSAARLVQAFGSEYFPDADHAVIEFNVRAVGHHPLLLGMSSRFGWSHPGPLAFFVLAAPYRLLGSRSVGMQVGALLVNALAIVGVALVARRRGGIPLVACALVPLVAMTHALGPDFLRDPWTPYIAVIPLFLLVVVTWAAATGDAAMLPWVVVVTSFVVQAHVGFAPVALVLLAWASVALLVPAWRRSVVPRGSDADRAVPWRWFAASAVIGIVLWLPPLYDELFGRHNLSDLVHYFLGGRAGAGYMTAWKVLALQLGPVPEWIFGLRPTFGGFVMSNVVSPVVVVLGAGICAATVAFARRRRGMADAWTFSLTVGLVLAASLVGVANIVGGLFTYLVRWTWVTGASVGVLVLWVASVAIGPRAGVVARRAVAVLALAVLAALSVAESVDVFGLRVPQSSEQPELHAVTAQLLAHLPPGGGPVLFRGTEGGFEESGIALQLERHGIAVRFERVETVRSVGSWDRAAGGPYRAELRVIDRPEALAAPRQPGELVFARWSQPYSAADRRGVERSLERVRRAFGPRSAIARALEAELHRARVVPRRAILVVGRAG